LKVVGSGDHLEVLKALVRRLGLDQRVSFLAPVPVERLPELLRQASLGVAPNLASHATHLMLPVKLLEFAALGIPALASRLRTIEHYFDDSSVAFFRSGDGADLARVIEELYQNPGRRLELARNANRVLQHLSFERQRASYYDALDSLTGQVLGGNAEAKNLDREAG
jgi:D-inositol-3-phosphate glycosyltransferase